MMLPPKSGRKAVRLRNASILSGISYLYSHLTSIWLSAGDPFDVASEKGAGAIRLWPPSLRAKFIYIAEQIQDLRVRTVMSKWEGNVRGVWPFEDYNRMAEAQSDMLSSLALVRVPPRRHGPLNVALTKLRCRWLAPWSTWTQT